ncbi:MAG TPA: hypothetical protein VN368_00975 [Candidatus Methylomirabilis sp.]|nr:hypothetical protein [Candidatus Methylomirabilis sp.]
MNTAADDQALSIFKDINSKLDGIRDYARNMDDKLRLLADAQAEKKKRFVSMLLQSYSIPADSSVQTPRINNPGFNRCRIEISAGFNQASSAGIGILMVYGNSPIGSVSDMISSNGAATYKSEPMDVKEFSGFTFELTNRDTSNAVTVNFVRIILYND